MSNNDYCLTGMLWGDLAAKLEGAVRELWRYRTEEDLPPRSGPGQIHPFVRGLYFSAKVVYLLRRLFAQQGIGLQVNWGQILLDGNCLCSRECDVIVHHEGGVQWDGDTGVFDFWFVPQSSVVAVVSCKAQNLTAPPAEEEAFAASVFPLVKQVFLLAEACPSADSGEKLRTGATALGFTDCWWLYAGDPDTPDVILAQPQWRGFFDRMLQIATVGDAGNHQPSDSPDAEGS
ncbi:hypothetical protein LLH23_03120 [bacterium]|nr:hypothetical protein [bacterium]